LDELDFARYVFEPSLEIFSYIKKKYPKIGLIWFPRNSAGHFLQTPNHEIFQYIDCLSVDYSTSLDLILQNIDERIFVQGNLDPSVLLTANQDEIKTKIDFIMNKMRPRNHIFNLGHGVIKTTPVENVQFIIDLVRGFY
jgi:uroporphyrinogen decarboxylase